MRKKKNPKHKKKPQAGSQEVKGTTSKNIVLPVNNSGHWWLAESAPHLSAWEGWCHHLQDSKGLQNSEENIGEED